MIMTLGQILQTVFSNVQDEFFRHISHSDNIVLNTDLILEMTCSARNEKFFERV